MSHTTWRVYFPEIFASTVIVIKQQPPKKPRQMIVSMKCQANVKLKASQEIYKKLRMRASSQEAFRKQTSVNETEGTSVSTN